MHSIFSFFHPTPTFTFSSAADFEEHFNPKIIEYVVQHIFIKSDPAGAWKSHESRGTMVDAD